MNPFDLLAALLVLSALFAYINARWIKLPTTIGVMLIALVFSLALLGLQVFGLDVREPANDLLGQLNFDETLLQGMLSYLLFAGALHVNLDDLAKHKWTIGLLASVGVVISTFLIAAMAWFVFQWLEVAIPFIYCLLFGALISPTDPIAVLGILKKARAPKSLEMKITGESLFNDGVGVVVFLVLLGIATGESQATVAGVSGLFVQEVLGGAIVGAVLGYATYRMLSHVDNYQVEILLTLGLVTGGYALALHFHLSGPIAVVVAGLLIGNHGRRLSMSERTREHLDTFWELMDELMNAVLFVMIGLEVLVLTWKGDYLLAGLILIPAVLLARFVAVSTPVTVMKRFREFTPGAIKVLTWGGLRGGISVALALSLPAGAERDLILTVTYCIVVFSIVIQGLTIGPLARRVSGQGAS